MRNGLAAVLIVKDEEEVLERCLKGLGMVDQLVILDTGSGDRTVEIARRFTSDVFTVPAKDPFHFGEARNMALTHAEEDWILTIDADEVVKEGSVHAVRKAFWRFPTAAGFKVKFVLYEEEGKNPTDIMKLKVFRRGLWTWQKRIDEFLVPTTGQSVVRDLPEAVLEHRPSSNKTARRKQNLELLTIEAAEAPGNIRTARQLGMELFHKEQWVAALEQFKAYIDGAPGNRLDESEVLMHIARCHSNMGRCDEAMKWFDRATAAAPERREPHYYRAVALIKARRLEEALAWLDACLEIPYSSKPDFFLNIADVWNGKLPEEAVAFCHAQIAEAKAKLEARRPAH